MQVSDREAELLGLVRRARKLKHEGGDGVLLHHLNTEIQRAVTAIIKEAPSKARRKRALLLKRLERRDGPNCWWCSDPIPVGEVTIDHEVPLSAGGSDSFENKRLSCEACNQARGGVHGPGSFKPGTVSRDERLVALGFGPREES